MQIPCREAQAPFDKASCNSESPKIIRKRKIKDAIFYLLNKANKQLKCCSKAQEGPQEAAE
jgi:hypothetical protein